MTAAVLAMPGDRIVFSTPSAGGSASFADSAITERQAADWASTDGVTDSQPIGIAQTRAEAGDRVPADFVVARVGNELVKTSVAGEIVTAHADIGKLANRGEPVVTMIDPTALRVVARVDAMAEQERPKARSRGLSVQELDTELMVYDETAKRAQQSHALDYHHED